jgi:hypothetical protein
MFLSRWRAKGSPTPAEVQAKSEKVIRFLSQRRTRLGGGPAAALPSGVESAKSKPKKESFELTKLKLKLDLELQENAKRIEAEVRQQVIERSVKICDLCTAAGESRMMATWVGQGLPLAEVAANLHKEIRESREIYEPERANRVAALVEAEVSLGLRSTPWGELRVC